MLVNAPLVDQLNEPTLDGGPDEGARANCVPASLTAAVKALCGPSAVVDGDALRDAVYGEGYSGATDPARYVAYLASQYGVAMVEYVNHAGGALVQQIIASLERHEPVTGAIPSQWAYAPPDPLNPVGGTHEVLWCDYDGAAGTLTAMNPWPEPPTNNAFYQTQPLDWWAARIVYGRVFTLSGGHPMSNVVPVWNAAAGTLAYPAHDGMAAITLDHGQAYYAQASRQGRYPLAPASYDGNGDSVVAWNDGLDSRAVKANGWAIVLEDSGPRIAAALAEAAQVATLSQQVAALKQQLADVGSAAQEIAQIRAILGGGAQPQAAA